MSDGARTGSDDATMRLSVAVAVAVCVAPRVGQAQQTEADVLVRRGVALRRQGRDAAALTLFRAAWELSPSPRVRAQMGLAAQELHRWLDAERWLSEALAAPDDPWVRAWVEHLEESQRQVRAHLCLVHVVAEEGVTVRVEGTATTGSVYLAPATVQVVYLREGQPLVEAPVTLAEGGEVTLRVPPPLVAPRVDPPPVVAPRVDPPPVVAPPVTSSPAPSPLRTLGWSLVGGAVVGATIGAVGVALQRDAASEFNDDARCGPRGAPVQPAHCLGLEGDAEAASTTAVVGFVAAGALALGGGLALLLAPTTRSARAAACAPTTQGLLCRWVF